MTTWTKEEFKFEVERLYKDMKQNGFTKADCKREILNLMKDNNITIKKK
jgi:hypothetical protein